MAITNQDRVGKAMELLREGLVPFVEREMLRPGPNLEQREKRLKAHRQRGEARRQASLGVGCVGAAPVDVRAWNEAFASTLGYAEQALGDRSCAVCATTGHTRSRSTSDNTDRALDSMARLLTAVSAAQADEVNEDEARAAPARLTTSRCAARSARPAAR